MSHATQPALQVVLLLTGGMLVLALAGACMSPDDQIVTVNDRKYRAECLWNSDLSSPQALATLTAEGTDRLTARDGWLWIDALAGPRPFCTVWLPGDYPPNIRIRYTARCPAPGGARNINLFFHARLADGRDVVEESASRTGQYDEYHRFPNYIFTYLGDQQLRVRMRRNPGFNLLAERYFPGGVPLATDIQLEVRVADGWIEYHELAPHPRLLLRHHDPNPLPGGRIGLRTWHSLVGYRDIQVDHLLPVQAP